MDFLTTMLSTKGILSPHGIATPILYRMMEIEGYRKNAIIRNRTGAR